MNKAEVKGMFLTEYDEKKILEQERQEEIEEGGVSEKLAKKKFSFNPKKEKLNQT